MLLEVSDEDVGGLGSGMSAAAVTADELQVNAWAAQFINCFVECSDLCNANKYRSQCWVERYDVTPPTI
jgi:hypothetical protein